MQENQVTIARNAAKLGVSMFPELNIHCQMSEEQKAARKENFVAGLRLNQFKLEQRARFK